MLFRYDKLVLVIRGVKRTELGRALTESARFEIEHTFWQLIGAASNPSFFDASCNITQRKLFRWQGLGSVFCLEAFLYFWGKTLDRLIAINQDFQNIGNSRGLLIRRTACWLGAFDASAHVRAISLMIDPAQNPTSILRVPIQILQLHCKQPIE